VSDEFFRFHLEGASEISETIMEINDLHKAILNFQERERGTANEREEIPMCGFLIPGESDRPGRCGVRPAPRSGRKEKTREVFGETPNTATGTVALPKHPDMQEKPRKT